MAKNLYPNGAPWLLMFLVLCLFVGRAHAVTLSIADASGSSGELFTAEVQIDDATDLLSADITISYDPDKVTATAAETTDLTSDFLITQSISFGQINVALATHTALGSGSGALAAIAFVVAEDVENAETQLSIAEAALYGSDLLSKEVTTVDGVVTIGAGDTDGGDDGEGPADKCFIATAAYGSPFAEDVVLLRSFRDRFLVTNTVGRALVDIYYTCSPPTADFIADHDKIRFMMRTLLAPLVFAIKYPLSALIIVLSLAGLFGLGLFSIQHKLKP